MAIERGQRYGAEFDFRLNKRIAKALDDTQKAKNSLVEWLASALLIRRLIRKGCNDENR